MMWHLKDRELEKKLIAIDPDFVDNLQKAVEYHENDSTVFVGLGSGIAGRSRLIIEFRWGELEEIPKYDPNDWNEYPKVTPPYDVMMLIDLAKKTYGLKGFYRHSKEGDYWCFADGSTVPTCLSEKIIRFRPWKD